jgi:lipopolysaccharide transport protein LptA
VKRRRGWLLALGLAALATPAVRAQLPAGPIELEADSSEIDRKNNHLVFHKVHIKQGDLSVRADEAQGSSLEFAEAEWVFSGAVQIDSAETMLQAGRATLHFVNHRVHGATLDGTPVVFEQARAGAAEPTRGHATRIEYDFEAQVLRLSGDAWLSEGPNEITGDNISYEIGAQRVVAGAEKQGERVRITIVPPPESPAPQTPPPESKP